MRGDQHRLAVVAGERDQPTEHRPPLERIEAVGRLIEDHHPRIVDDRRGEGHLLPRADRECFHGPIPFLSGVAPIEYLVGSAQALGAGQSAQPRCIPHHLDTREPRHGAFVFGHDAQQRPHPPRLKGRIKAEHADAPRDQPDEPQDRSHERALAGTVGTHESGHAGRDLERNAIEHRTAAVAFHHAIEPHGEIVAHEIISNGIAHYDSASCRGCCILPRGGPIQPLTAPSLPLPWTLRDRPPWPRTSWSAPALPPWWSRSRPR